MKEKYSWKLSDLIIPTLAVILAFYYLYTIQGIPEMAQMYGGTLSYGVLILSAVMLFLVAKSGAFKKASNPSTLLKQNWNSPTFKIYKKVIVLVTFIALYILVIPYLGYPVTSIIFMSAVMYFLGMPSIPRIIGIATCVTLLGYGLFILFLNVQLPLDPLTEKIKYLVR